jgi:carboxymethylenebutenolidase
VDAEEAHHLMSNLDFPMAVKEIRAAAQFLRAEGSKKIGVIGFCMG